MIVTVSGGEYVADFEDFCFSRLGYNEVWGSRNNARSSSGYADVAACTFIEDKMVPG